MSQIATPFVSAHLNNACYHQPTKLRGYNGRVTVLRAHTARDGAKVLKAVNPLWTPQDHHRLAEQHLAESKRLAAEHSALLDQAHQETFGCSPSFEDYKVSGIGRSEYSEEKKAKLRFAAQATGNHKTLSLAHAAACVNRA